jgi:DNA transposition AAA+ family ATPase
MMTTNPVTDLNSHPAGDENLRRWLADYLASHPEHTTAVLARADYIGISKRALEAYLAGRYFLPRGQGGEGADPATSRLEPSVRAFRSRVQSLEQHSRLGTFVETGAWKYLQHACDTALNENAVVVVYGRPGVGKTRCLLEYAARRMATLPVSVTCSPNITSTSFVRHLAHLVGADVRRQTYLTEEEIALRLRRSPKALFIDQANYLDEKSLGTLCFLWERQHLPIVLTGTKQLYDIFFQSRLTEEIRGQLSSRIALHYLLPELTQAETRAIVQRALGDEATEEMVALIHSVTGGIFRGVDMMIPRILELQQRNEQKLADGKLKTSDLIKTAASRLMI